MRDRLIIVAAAAAAFGLSLAGAFHLDDYSLLGERLEFPPLRPLTYVTFWLNRTLGGWHFTSLALHTLAAVLVREALSAYLGRKAALIAAVLFAVHPLQTESVAYVFARPILLATVFCLLALMAWTAERRGAAFALFLLALASKEEVAAFPFVLLLLRRTKRDLAWAGGMAAAAFAVGAFTVWIGIRSPGLGVATGSPLEYLAAQGAAIPRYLGLMIAPWGFTVDPDIRARALWMWPVMAGAAAFAAWRWEAGRWFAAGFLSLLPSSSLFPAADLAADRRMYLPMVFFCAAAGFLLARLRWQYAAAAAAILAGLSVQRCAVWNSEQSLWAEAVERSPRKMRPKLQLARVSEPARAFELLKQAESLAPEDARVYAEAGRLHLQLGQYAAALASFGRALALNPGDPRALNNRGAALMALGDRAGAQRDFEHALAADPCLREARENLLRLGVTPAARCATD